MQGGIAGRILDAGLKFRNGGIEVRLLQIRCSQIRAVASVAGPQPQRRLKFRDRYVAVPILQQRQSQIIVRVRILRLQSRIFPKRFDGLARVARMLQ